MEYSRKQQIISEANRIAKDNSYIINKREEGQKKLFVCNCCGKEFDLGDSIDYVGAVEQWARFGERCYACAKGLCHCKEATP